MHCAVLHAEVTQQLAETINLDEGRNGEEGMEGGIEGGIEGGMEGGRGRGRDRGREEENRYCKLSEKGFAIDQAFYFKQICRTKSRSLKPSTSGLVAK